MCKAKSGITAAILLLMAGLFIGCSKTETPTSTTDTVTVSKTALCYISNYGGVVTLVSDPMADTSLSNATLSWGGSKTSRVFQDKYFWSSHIEFDWFPDSAWHDDHQFKDTVLNIAVTSNIGNCQGTIQVPDSAYINTPSYNDTLSIDSVTCIWAAVARAEWYEVYYYADAYSSSNYIGELDGKETLTTGTSITIPASYFNYPGAQYYHVFVHVCPYRGPKPQAGSTGNMTGTIKGFLVGEGRGDWTNFYVGTPPKGLKTSIMEHKVPSRQERMTKYLEAVTGQ